MNSEIFQDPGTFYAIAFTVFVALAFVYGRKPAMGWLDSEIAKIRVELDTARHLRAEAEATLADCKEKQARAEADAKYIVETARRDAEEMRAQAEADLAAAMARHQQMASDRIRLAENEAIADVRKAAIEAAVLIARQNLEKLAPADAARLIDQAIADIPALKPSKAQAA